MKKTNLTKINKPKQEGYSPFLKTLRINEDTVNVYFNTVVTMVHLVSANLRIWLLCFSVIMSTLEAQYFQCLFISLITYMYFRMPVKKIWAIHFNSNNLLNKKALMERQIKSQFFKYSNQRWLKNCIEAVCQSLNKAPCLEEVFISLCFPTAVKSWIEILLNEKKI